MVEDVQVGMNVRQYVDPAFLLEVESEAAKKQPPAVANAPLVRERAAVAAGLTEDNLRSGAWGVVGRQADLVDAGAMPRTSAFTVEWTKPRGCIDCLAVNASTAPRRVQLEGERTPGRSWRWYGRASVDMSNVSFGVCSRRWILSFRQAWMPCGTTSRSRTTLTPLGRPRWTRPAATRTTC